MFKIKIEYEEVWIQTLIIPKLIPTLIIRMDLINNMEMVINFNTKIIQFKINNNEIELKFEDINKKRILCYTTKNNNNYMSSKIKNTKNESESKNDKNVT